jgi:hypothetical protein
VRFLVLNFSFRRLLFPFVVSQGSSSPCLLCNNRTFPCHPATRVDSGADSCAIRKAAWVRPAWGCQGGLFLETYLQVYDELGLANPDVPTFNVHVFGNTNDTVAYKNCANPIPSPIKSFFLQSCVAFEHIDVGFLERDQSLSQDQRFGPWFAVECLNPDGCSVRVQYFNNCTLKGTGAYPLGVSGITLCSFVIGMCVLVGFQFGKHKRLVTLEMTCQLSGISLVMILNLVFWICFFLTSSVVFPFTYTTFSDGHPPQADLYSQLTDTIFWVDKIVLILSCQVHLGFLYQFVVAVHAQCPRFVQCVCVVFVVAGFGCIGLPIPFYLNMHEAWGGQPVYLIAFYSVMYGTQMLESLLFLAYGLVLLRGHYLAHGFDRKTWKTVILLVLLVLPNIGRLIAVLYTWVRFYFAVSSGNYKELYFAGFDYFLMRFRNHESARLFYVFGFLIPDVVPYIVFLVLLFDIVYQSVNVAGKQESGEPLLERSVPAAYEI